MHTMHLFIASGVAAVAAAIGQCSAESLTHSLSAIINFNTLRLTT